MADLSSSMMANTSMNLDDKIRAWISANSPKVYILTPCYGAMTHTTYTVCLINTLKLLESYGVKTGVEFCMKDSLVPRARNNLVAKAMNDPATTHMIFIDSDIIWNGYDILKLLLSDKALVGGIYPLKSYDWKRMKNAERLLEAKNKNTLSSLFSDDEFLRYRMVNYNANLVTGETQIENNLLRVRHLATGFMLFKRETVLKLMTAFPSTKYTDDIGFLSSEENKYAYALFDCSVEGGHYYSEDWLFCERWSGTGGEVFVDVSIKLSHQGVEIYEGHFLSSLIT